MIALLRRMVALVLSIALAGGSACAFAQRTYNIASFGDFSGPFANIYPPTVDARRAVIDWWNADVGAKLGVAVRMKTYDARYDTATIASLWPGAKAELNPVVVLGIGGAEMAALMTRLPDDGVPMVLGTAAYGFAMKPDPWVFLARPAYGYEVGAFVDWMSARLKRPVKFAAVSSDANPGMADMSKGIIAYATANPTKARLTETIYTAMAPVDLTLQMRRALNAEVDVVVATGTAGQVVAVKRALQSLGKKIPVVTSMHNGIGTIADSLGGLAAVEGDYEVYGAAIPADGQSRAHDFHSMLRKTYALKSDWNSGTILAMGQALMAVRAIERAAKKVGPDKVTGAAVREAILAGPISSTDLFGFFPDLEYNREAPTPFRSTVNIGTVQGGKLVEAGTKVPVPVIPKWW